MKGNGIKLAIWAKQNGLTYKGAYRLFRAGQLPCRTMQLATGTIIAEVGALRRPAEPDRALLITQRFHDAPVVADTPRGGRVHWTLP